MKRMKPMFLYLALILCCSVGMLCGCIDEEDGPTKAKGTGDLTLMLKLDVPQNSVPETRGMTSGNETTLGNMKILVFKNDGGTEKYAYTAYVDKFTSSSVTVKLIRSTASEQYRLVLLANVGTLPAIAANETKAAVLNKITVATTTNWPTTGATSYIPMWGETGLQTIADNTTIPTVSLLRALAKVDVDCSTITTTMFSLKHVYVYNTNNKAYAAPLTANVSGTAVTAPSIPADAAKNSVLTYNTASNNYTNEIYLAEAAKGSINTLSSSPCLVIGGIYNNSGTETFYRVDFIKKTGDADTYLDILRNKQYKVKINSVSGAGYNTKEDAFNARAVNMSVDITAWDASGMSEIAFDGQYTLGVGQSEITVDEFTNYVEIPVNTTYSGGYELELTPPDTDDFILPYYTTRSSNTSGKKRIRLYILPNFDRINPGRGKRSATIYVKSGRLKLSVTIRQEAGKVDEGAFAFLFPHSNCYVIERSMNPNFLISVQYKGESKEPVGATSTIEVVWEKPIGKSYRPGMIQKLAFYDAQKKYAKFEVTSPGNALIAVKDAAGTILWSWHIWIPDATQGIENYAMVENNPLSLTLPPPSKIEDGYSMFMNLGAMQFEQYYGSFDAGSYEDIGCLYQWGRKDPFPWTLRDIDQVTPTIFNSSHTEEKMKTLSVDFATQDITPEYITAFPDRLIITNNSDEFKWISDVAKFYMPDGGLLWGGTPPLEGLPANSPSIKTIYDPSPFGWKIPNANESLLTALSHEFELEEYNPGWRVMRGNTGWIPKNPIMKYKQILKSVDESSACTMWLSSTATQNHIIQQTRFQMINFTSSIRPNVDYVPSVMGLPVRSVCDR